MIDKIVAEIDAEIAKLQQAKTLLLNTSSSPKRGPGRPAKTVATAGPKKTKRRKMSAEAREKIRQAQLQRWAANKKSEKTSAK